MIIQSICACILKMWICRNKYFVRSIEECVNNMDEMSNIHGLIKKDFVGINTMIHNNGKWEWYNF